MGLVKRGFGKMQIVGSSPELRADGMPEQILVVRDHGSDWTAAYFHGSYVRLLLKENKRIGVLEEELREMELQRDSYAGGGKWGR